MTGSMQLDAPPEQVLRRMVDLAGLAPSIHNTQPWSWRLSGHEAWLYADRDRLRPLEDPLGRNLVMSCGAALHHFQLAARALGWRADVERLPEPTDPTLLAHVRLHREPCPNATEVLEAIRTRCTDRRRFTSWPVPEERLEALCAEAQTWGAVATPVLDLATRFRLERTIRTALLSHFGDAAVSNSGDDVESSDSLILLGGTADDDLSWLRTGEALSALWIRATRTGLSVLPLSMPVEVSATRGELKAHLGGAIEPHLLVRIGWQAIGRSELPRTPRRPIDEVLRP